MHLYDLIPIAIFLTPRLRLLTHLRSEAMC